jgi:hypothetical protein
MVTTQRARELLQAQGWRADRFGHLRKSVTRVVTGGTYVAELRVKVLQRVIRVEVQGARGADGKRPWTRIGGGYLSECAELPDGRLRLGGYIVGKPA